MQDNAGNKKDEDDYIQVEIKALIGEMEEEVKNAHGCKDNVDNVAVINPVSQRGLRRQFNFNRLIFHFIYFFRRDGNHILFFRVDQIKQDGKANDNNGRRKQVPCRKDGVRHGNNFAGDFFNQILGMFGCCQQQRDGAGEAHVPADETAVGSADQNGKVNIPVPSGHFKSQESRENQPETPVYPGTDAPHKGNDHCSFNGGACFSRYPVEDFFHRRCQGKDITRNQNKNHLHRKGDNPIDAIAPGRNDLGYIGRCKYPSEGRGKKCENNSEQIGVRQIMPHDEGKK